MTRLLLHVSAASKNHLSMQQHCSLSLKYSDPCYDGAEACLSASHAILQHVESTSGGSQEQADTGAQLGLWGNCR